MSWSDEDQQAALEWQAYKDSLCSGCGLPRVESFDPANQERYDVEVLRCFACRERERTAFNRNAARDNGSPPLMGEYYAITGPNGVD